ncbi:MAG: hypothetical protein ACKOWK_01130 [Micrococcales bacterium]
MAVAVLLIGSDDEQLRLTRAGVESQTLAASEIVSAQDLDSALTQLQQTRHLDPGVWIWPLIAGMVPDPDALRSLTIAAEQSPSAAWIAPKLVRLDRQRVLVEYGLTVGRGWLPFSPASGQFDQSQHDSREEFLAATPYGSLLRLTDFAAAGGLAQGASAIANYYRLAISLRMSGLRVTGAPDARVAVPDSLESVSSLSEYRLRQAQIQLFTGYANPVWSLTLAVLAPLIAGLISVWYLLAKRPERIGAALLAGFWWFGTGLWLVSHRPAIRPKRSGLAVLRQLRATREDFERGRNAQVEQPSAIAEAALELSDTNARFVPSQGLWIMAALALLSWQFWPQTSYLSGGGVIPLGDNLAHIFSRAGASWQNLGFGLAAPSDPFNWVLFLLGTITFWSPSLSVALLFFLAKPIAFAAAWRLFSLATRKAWIVTIGALAYTFWPALTNAQLTGQLGVLLALTLLPWFVFTLARILRLGASERRSVQTWTWVGIGALLAAIIGASAPSLMPLVALIILFLAVYRFKRIGYLMWLPVPLLAVWAPFAWYLAVGLGHPLELLTQPGLDSSEPKASALQFLGGSQLPGPLGQYGLYLSLAITAVAALASVGRKPLQAGLLTLAYAAAVVSAFAYQQLGFQVNPTFDTQEFGQGSPLALLGLAGLVATVALVLCLDGASSVTLRILGSVAAVGVVGLAGLFAVAPSTLTWAGSSQMPALVEAQARINPLTRVLVLRPQVTTGDTQKVSGSLVTGGGVWLEDLSTSYNYSVAGVTSKDHRYHSLARLVANLVSANGFNPLPQLRSAGVDFVLLPAPQQSPAVAASLATVSQLEPVGDTEFGRLWKVTGTVASQPAEGWQWSLTKQIQVGVLAIFALLAIPTRRRSSASKPDADDEDLAEGFSQEVY